MTLFWMDFRFQPPTEIQTETENAQTALKWILIQGGFLTGSAQKVLSVGDGKIPTKKVKVRECHR